jgi:hypothetical protein
MLNASSSTKRISGNFIELNDFVFEILLVTGNILSLLISIIFSFLLLLLSSNIKLNVDPFSNSDLTNNP